MVTVSITHRGFGLVRLGMTGPLAGMLSRVVVTPIIQIGVMRAVEVGRRVLAVPVQEEHAGLAWRDEQCR